MPRSNRPRRKHVAPGQRDEHDEGRDGLDRLRAGWRRTETQRGVEWNVQPVSAVQAVKIYVCPGCGETIDAGSAHLVTWRADGILGDQADIAARRHWHTSCWRIG